MLVPRESAALTGATAPPLFLPPPTGTERSEEVSWAPSAVTPPNPPSQIQRFGVEKLGESIPTTLRMYSSLYFPPCLPLHFVYIFPYLV